MNKEQKLYDKFVDVLNDILDGEPTPKELDVILNFLKHNNIQASTQNKGLSNLMDKITQLPFEEEDLFPKVS